jgi:outer membrane protein TolC
MGRTGCSYFQRILSAAIVPVIGLTMVGAIGLPHPAHAQISQPFPWMPEQRSIQVRDPSELVKTRIPDAPPPATVSDPQAELEPRLLSLDEAIRISLANGDVVRVLSGVAAVNSGRTIYDPAITNTTIDQQQSRFDPFLEAGNNWNQSELPTAVFGPLGPPSALITGTKTEGYYLNVGLGKNTVTGGRASLGVNASPSYTTPGAFPLNPSTRSSLDLSYTQPLLQGGGVAVNLAPLVLARIDTERSYFQFKDATQEHVRGVIEAYWQLVFARVDAWARARQVEQAAEAFRIAEGRQRAMIGNIADVAQARVTLANFRSILVSSQANVLLREAAVRNILGLPPTDGSRIVPTSPPTTDVFEPNWSRILEIAEEQRPDLIELKLILEADQQQLLIAKNQVNPRLDAVALYRWNGLEGELASGAGLSSNPGQFTDWTLGINFSVPLGLRQGRAGLRQRELLIARDRANLEQGMHNVVHAIAINLRGISQFQEQYLVLREAREAAEVNLKAQLGRFRTNQALFLSVLQAITDWGNAVSGEANALSQYNIQLASLERQSGSILETHGIAFYEERMGSIGPLGRWRKEVCYPSDMRPGPNSPLYTESERPAEEAFRLQDPSGDRRRPFSPEEIQRIPLPSAEELSPPQEKLPPGKAEIPPATPNDDVAPDGSQPDDAQPDDARRDRAGPDAGRDAGRGENPSAARASEIDLDAAATRDGSRLPNSLRGVERIPQAAPRLPSVTEARLPEARSPTEPPTMLPAVPKAAPQPESRNEPTVEFSGRESDKPLELPSLQAPLSQRRRMPPARGDRLPQIETAAGKTSTRR